LLLPESGRTGQPLSFRVPSLIGQQDSQMRGCTRAPTLALARRTHLLGAVHVSPVPQQPAPRMTRQPAPARAAVTPVLVQIRE
jgi:hypothetical protein